MYHIQALTYLRCHVSSCEKIWCLRGKQTINPSQVLWTEALRHGIWLQLAISKGKEHTETSIGLPVLPRKGMNTASYQITSLCSWTKAPVSFSVGFDFIAWRYLELFWMLGSYLTDPPEGTSICKSYFRAASDRSLRDL